MPDVLREVDRAPRLWRVTGQLVLDAHVTKFDGGRGARVAIGAADEGVRRVELRRVVQVTHLESP